MKLLWLIVLIHIVCGNGEEEMEESDSSDINICFIIWNLFMIFIHFSILVKAIQCYKLYNNLVKMEKENKILKIIDEKIHISSYLQEKISNKLGKVQFDSDDRIVFCELSNKARYHFQEYNRLFQGIFVNKYIKLNKKNLEYLHENIDKNILYFNQMVMKLSEIKSKNIESHYNSIIQENSSMCNYNTAG